MWPEDALTHKIRHVALGDALSAVEKAKMLLSFSRE
jgi:hypothetical protein